MAQTSGNAATNVTLIAEPGITNSSGRYVDTQVIAAKWDIGYDERRTPANTTGVRNGLKLTNSRCRVDTQYIGTVDLGQRQMYFILQQAILSIFQATGTKLRTSQLVIDQRPLNIKLTILLPTVPQTSQPWNTKAYSLQVISALGSAIGEDKRFNPIVAIATVDGQLVQRTFVTASRQWS